MQKIAFCHTFALKNCRIRHASVRPKGWLLLLALIGIAIGGHFTYLKLSRNFHEVVVGEVYRSAQPSGHDIQRFSETYGIKTILNLRGANPGRAWYQQELAASENLGIHHIDFEMSSTEELSLARAHELVEVMRHAPKPLLIHCEAGVNRTGLASALYLAAISDKKPQDAELQLSLMYGYVSVWLTERYAMMRSYQKMEPLFGTL